MRVFVTGATGWVGSAIVQELIGAGHQVLGLVRSDRGAASVAAAGAEPLRGSLQDLASLQAGAARADAVIHTAFNHDFSKFAENGADEQRAIAALGDALAGSGRTLIATSGIALLAPGDIATEQTSARTASAELPRDPENPIAALLARGVRASVVRLPPSVHGHGDHGFVPRLIAIAREQGLAAYIGEGTNRWPAVHRLDAARLYRLALEHPTATGPFHAVADTGIDFRDIASVIGRRLGLPVLSRTKEEAAAYFGWFAPFAAFDCPASSEQTRKTLGWQPQQPGLIADLDHPAYFAA